VSEPLTADRPDYPCLWCGTPLDECGFGNRCCPENDHPYATIREVLAAWSGDAVTAHIATLDAARDGPGLDEYVLAEDVTVMQHDGAWGELAKGTSVYVTATAQQREGAGE
jgi:hypothetical protein